MICKIWGIKGGNKKHINRSLDYIENEEKTTPKGNAQNVLDYMNNKDKTRGKYVSGYLCNPATAIEEFALIREKDLEMKGQTEVKDDEIIAFHLIQSFAEGTNIDPDLVHKCGLELCEMLGLYQAVVCTHLNTDNFHNHIIFNAYCKDPIKQFGEQNKYQKIKYHDCKETYAQLQMYNDEIARKYGLIIEEGDKDINYSWLENVAKSNTSSWKDILRYDIVRISGDCKNWQEYLDRMRAEGYTIKEGKYVTYSKGNDVKPVRDKTLGPEYTKDYIINKWAAVSEFLDTYDKENDNIVFVNDANIKKEDSNGLLVRLPESKDYIRVAKGKYHKEGDGYTLYLKNNGLYPIFDEKEHLKQYNQAVAVNACFEDKNDESKGLTYEDLLNGKNNYKATYFYHRGWNNKKKHPYRVSRWTKDGYRKTELEVIIELAIKIITHENNNPSSSFTYNPYQASTDWKVQNMINVISSARVNNIDSVNQLNTRLDVTGKNISKTRTLIRKSQETLGKMTPIYHALEGYQELKELYNKIKDLPEKDRAAYQNEINKYINRTEMLKRYNINSDEQMNDFLTRFNNINEHIKDLENKLDESKKEYRQLKYIDKALDYCNDKDFCYGIGTTVEKEEPKEVVFIRTALLHRSDEENFYFQVPKVSAYQYVQIPKKLCQKSSSDTYKATLDSIDDLSIVDYNNRVLKKIKKEELFGIYSNPSEDKEEAIINREIKEMDRKNRKGDEIR